MFSQQQVIYLRVLIAGSMTTTGNLDYWDEEENNVSEGYKYNTGPSFNYHDDDWNQLARTTLEKKYFLSDDVIAASYDGTPPSSFAEITSMDHVTF